MKGGGWHAVLCGLTCARDRMAGNCWRLPAYAAPLVCRLTAMSCSTCLTRTGALLSTLPVTRRAWTVRAGGWVTTTRTHSRGGICRSRLPFSRSRSRRCAGPLPIPPGHAGVSLPALPSALTPSPRHSVHPVHPFEREAEIDLSRTACASRSVRAL